MSTPLSQARTQFPRLAEAAVERARLTVVPRRTQKAPRVPFVSLVSLLLVRRRTQLQQESHVAQLQMQADAGQLCSLPTNP